MNKLIVTSKPMSGPSSLQSHNKPIIDIITKLWRRRNNNPLIGSVCRVCVCLVLYVGFWCVGFGLDGFYQFGHDTCSDTLSNTHPNTRWTMTRSRTRSSVRLFIKSHFLIFFIESQVSQVHLMKKFQSVVFWLNSCVDHKLLLLCSYRNYNSSMHESCQTMRLFQCTRKNQTLQIYPNNHISQPTQVEKTTKHTTICMGQIT